MAVTLIEKRLVKSMMSRKGAEIESVQEDRMKLIDKSLNESLFLRRVTETATERYGKEAPGYTNKSRDLAFLVFFESNEANSIVIQEFARQLIEQCNHVLALETLELIGRFAANPGRCNYICNKTDELLWTENKCFAQGVAEAIEERCAAEVNAKWLLERVLSGSTNSFYTP